MLCRNFLITRILKNYEWFILLFNIYFTGELSAFKGTHDKDFSKALEDLKQTIEGEFALILVILQTIFIEYYPRNLKYLQELIQQSIIVKCKDDTSCQNII